jgi:hypothetical protein
MPDWATVQAAAYSNHCKIIIRVPLPAREHSSAYYFQLHPTITIRNKYILVIPNDSGDSAIFHRFYASDHHKSGHGCSRLYNSSLKGNWGFFLPHQGSQWYEYLTIPKTHWVFDCLWAHPKEGPISTEQFRRDPQLIWENQIPVPPHDTESESETEHTFRCGNQSEEEEINLEEDIPDTLDHHEAVAVDNLFRHYQAGTITPTVISETLESILGSSSSSTNIPSPDLLNTYVEQLIEVDEPYRAIPPELRQPANISSPARPNSDDWLQPPLSQSTTPEERPKSLQIPSFQPNTALHKTSTPMDRMANLHMHLKQTGFVAGSSQHPIRAETTTPHPGINPRMLSDQRIRELGTLDAQLSNLETAIIRNSNKLSDGRPPVNITGTKIQSPSPELVLTDDLLTEFNTIALAAMTKMSTLLIDSQLKAMSTIWENRKDLLDRWKPDEQEIEAAKKFEASRTHKETVFKARPIAGGKTTYKFEDQEKGIAFVPVSEIPPGNRPPSTKNFARPRRPQTPPRDSERYTGARPRSTSTRARMDRQNYGGQDEDSDQERPRFDQHRNTRYFQPNQKN